ncbi:MAG: efflux RND transporter periplasmic adaptor subunit [Bacillota bacterium]
MAQQHMARRAWQWPLIAALAVVLGAAGGWWWLAARRAEGGPADRAARLDQALGPGGRAGAVTEQRGRELLQLATQAGVRAVPVRRMDIRRYVEATGKVTALRDLNLAFGVAGRLQAVHVVEGDRVKAGQVLAALDDTTQRLAYVRARNEYEQARLELGPAQVEERRLSMEAAREDLEATKLVAPFDGVVVSVLAKAGEIVGTSQAVVRLVDFASLQVEVAVDEVDLPHVRPGQPALVSLKGYPDLVLQGVVERLATAARSQGDLVLFDVVVRSQEARQELLPGMTATARIEVERADNVLAVPEEAVVEAGGRSLVSRVVDGSVVLTPVQLGVSDGRFVEVRAGLNEGDQVLATNYEAYRRLSGDNAGPSPNTFFRIGPSPVPRGVSGGR